jgi:hypothetical protein
MYKLDTIQEDTWFCNLEHIYAYKVTKDIEWNPDYNLWTRIRHYTESSRNARHAYDLNQSRIFRLAQIQLGESNEEIAQALEPLATDRSNQDYTYDEVNLIMRASQVQLTDTEENELQRILAESFDISHPDFDQRKAMENLQKNFQGTVGLCQNCLMAKKKTELEQYEAYCQECYEELYPPVEPEPTPPSPPETPNLASTNETQKVIELLQDQIQQQAQIIELLQKQVQFVESQTQTIATLQAKVNKFETFYRQLKGLCDKSLEVENSSELFTNF